MTSPKDDRDEHASRDDATADRTYWLTEQLGEHWRSEGDGVYRLVDSPDAPPEVVSDEQLRDAHAPLTRDPSGPVVPPSTKRPRWRVPWRRR
jgi:hypothetical protein